MARLWRSLAALGLLSGCSVLDADQANDTRPSMSTTAPRPSLSLPPLAELADRPGESSATAPLPSSSAKGVAERCCEDLRAAAARASPESQASLLFGAIACERRAATGAARASRVELERLLGPEPLPASCR